MPLARLWRSGRSLHGYPVASTPSGASPDEVGYGYTEVLANELIGAIELLVLTVLCLVPMAIAVMFGVSRLRRTRRKQQLAKASLPARARKLFLWCLVLPIPLVLISLPVLAWLEGAEAAKGLTSGMSTSRI
jgi:hypothetical protein